MTFAQNITPKYTTQRTPLPILGEGLLTHAKALRKNMTEA
jgi:hypothetical protein